MNIRMVDMHTGEIRVSENVTTSATIASVAEGDPCAGISLSSINVLGEDATDGIANKMTMGIFPISVARVSDAGEVYLNYGEGTIAPNSILTVKTVGEGFYDPVSGELLGTEEVTNAVIYVSDVRPSFSVGRVIAYNNAINVGDIAYFIEENRDTSRAIRACTSSQQKRANACERDPDGRSCSRETENELKTCSALLDM